MSNRNRNSVDKIVGYVSRKGYYAAYVQLARTPDKFNQGNFRVLLQSLTSESIKFWVDEEQLRLPPINNSETIRN